MKIIDADKLHYKQVYIQTEKDFAPLWWYLLKRYGRCRRSCGVGIVSGEIKRAQIARDSERIGMYKPIVSADGEKGEKMRLIDADTLKEHKYHSNEDGTPVEKISAWKQGWNDAIDAIANYASTVDAVEVVRCKDCKFFRRYGFRLEYADCIKFDFYDTTEDGYCCWAERREDAN